MSRDRLHFCFGKCILLYVTVFFYQYIFPFLVYKLYQKIYTKIHTIFDYETILGALSKVEPTDQLYLLSKFPNFRYLFVALPYIIQKYFISFSNNSKYYILIIHVIIVSDEYYCILSVYKLSARSSYTINSYSRFTENIFDKSHFC